jgi:hypothetical protein
MSLAPFLNIMKSFLVAVLVLFIIVSCKKADETDLIKIEGCESSVFKSVVYNSSLRSNGIIPFATGNFWVYADSVWKDGNLLTSGYDTLRITDVSNYNGELWWRFSDGSQLSERNDTVFELNRFIRCYRRETLFFPLSHSLYQDSICYYISMNGYFDMIYTTRNSYISDQIIKTPAGQFRECSRYDILNNKSQIVKPGIGVIMINEEVSALSYKHHKVLVSYHLQ